MQKISLSLILLGAVGAESCFHPQIAFAFGNIKTVTGVQHPDRCQQECAAVDECHFYTYFPATRDCVLKGEDAIKSAYFLKGAFSGSRECCEKKCDKGNAFSNVEVENMNECRLQCFADPNCTKYMWTEASGCTLKLAAGQQVSSAKRCCGIECVPPLLSPCVEPSVAYVAVITNETLTAESLAECSKACDEDPDCEVFTFHQDGRCWLAKMTEQKYKREAEHTVSGRRNCCVTKDVEYQGLDYMDISGIKSAQACRSECLIREACVAWNFKADSTCNLKLNINGWAAAEGAASGSRMCCVDENMDYPGDDLYPNNAMHTETYQECQYECQKDDDCEYFTWNTDKECWLKKAFNHYKRNNSAISGPKTCCKEFGIDFTDKQETLEKHSDDEICIKSCMDADDCFMMAFNRSSKVCHHQNIIGQRFFDKNVVSAITHC